MCNVQSDLSEQGSGIVSLSVTNLAEILILSSCSPQISTASSRASIEIQEKLKSKSSSRRLFATLIPPTCKLFFNSGTVFILTKLGSISLTEIVLKIVFVNNIKLQLHSFFAAKDFTPHKPHFRALFFARPRVTGNTKLDYWKSTTSHRPKPGEPWVCQRSLTSFPLARSSLSRFSRSIDLSGLFY